MRYRVQLSLHKISYKILEVEADSPENAKKKALKKDTNEDPDRNDYCDPTSSKRRTVNFIQPICNE